jgi:argininosuccinate lyase
LIRAKCNRLQAVPNELMLLTANLPSGYHRDMQLTKEILFPAIAELRSCLEMMHRMISSMDVKKDILRQDIYRYIFSVEAVNRLVNQGIPFREAYRQVGNDISEGRFRFDPSTPLQHTHEGSIGNLCTEDIRKEMDRVMAKIVGSR